MNDQIKARGWLWDRSEKFTQWVAYKCLDCGLEYTYPHNHIIRECKDCNSDRIVKTGYVRRVKGMRE